MTAPPASFSSLGLIHVVGTRSRKGGLVTGAPTRQVYLRSATRPIANGARGNHEHTLTRLHSPALVRSHPARNPDRKQLRANVHFTTFTRSKIKVITHENDSNCCVRGLGADYRGSVPRYRVRLGCHESQQDRVVIADGSELPKDDGGQANRLKVTAISRSNTRGACLPCRSRSLPDPYLSGEARVGPRQVALFKRVA